MQSRIALAVALVVILAAGAFLGVASPARAATAAPAAAPHPAAIDAIYPVNSADGGVSGYWVGLSTGGIYFNAYDPSDTSAKVSVNDLNATRDGLTNPVMTWTVTFAPPFYMNDSTTWPGGVYHLPLTLVHGGWWNLTISGATAGFASQTFLVHTYEVFMIASQPAELARHTGQLLYFVNLSVNNAPDLNYTTLSMSGQYYTTGNVWAKLPGTPAPLPVSPWGAYNFTVPSDASTYGFIDFTLTANTTAGTFPNTEVGLLQIPLGYVTAPTVSLGTCASGCLSNTFEDGTPVYVDVTAVISTPYGTYPAVGFTANFEFDAGVTPVTPLGNYPKSITTNGTGGAEILFLATTTVFSTTQSNSVKVTITDPVDSSSTYGPTNVSFSVTPQLPGMARLQVVLDSSQYYGGDTIQATWQVGGLNASLAQGWTVDGWWAWEANSRTLLASGPIGSTQSQGTFALTAPTGYQGEIQVDVSAHNATGSIGAMTTADVSPPSIFLNPSEADFLPGDHITVGVTTLGSVFQTATLYASVVDNSGNVLQSGAFTGSQIQIQVPKVGSPSFIEVSVAAQDSTLGVVGASSIRLFEGSGLLVTAGVATVSNYIDGSYQPGQTITIHYAVTAIGSAVLPKTYTVEVYPWTAFFGSDYGAQETQSSSSSGSVQYTIPSGTPAGAQLFEVYVMAGACVSACYGGSDFSININPNPSVVGMEIGAGSGITVGWIILLVIILVVAVLLLFLMRRRARPMVMHPHEDAGAPPAAAETGPDAPPPGSSWSEAPPPPPSENPPLPEPPAQ
jgi:hypothetical protein